MLKEQPSRQRLYALPVWLFWSRPCDPLGPPLCSAAALTPVTFIPLCLAPLFYGCLRESFAALRLLRAAALALVCLGGMKARALER